VYVNFEILNAMAKKLKLSVIIPCKNEEENIRQCIKSVIDISEEVIVADSGSTDNTMQIAKNWGVESSKENIVFPEISRIGLFRKRTRIGF